MEEGETETGGEVDRERTKKALTYMRVSRVDISPCLQQKCNSLHTSLKSRMVEGSPVSGITRFYVEAERAIEIVN